MEDLTEEEMEQHKKIFYQLYEKEENKKLKK